MELPGWVHSFLGFKSSRVFRNNLFTWDFLGEFIPFLGSSLPECSGTTSSHPQGCSGTICSHGTSWVSSFLPWLQVLQIVKEQSLHMGLPGWVHSFLGFKSSHVFRNNLFTWDFLGEFIPSLGWSHLMCSGTICSHGTSWVSSFLPWLQILQSVQKQPLYMGLPGWVHSFLGFKSSRVFRNNLFTWDFLGEFIPFLGSSPPGCSETICSHGTSWVSSFLPWLQVLQSVQKQSVHMGLPGWVHSFFGFKSSRVFRNNLFTWDFLGEFIPSLASSPP